ncbi:MAG: colanic acid biosynthesis glycosyltransferase WcaL, partial [Calditrichota bacterium]
MMQKFETQNSSYTGLRIAYLGPEIPALSATFIYREILALERQGVSVLSLSVHKPKHAATETEAWELARRTVYIYAAPLLQFLLANLKALFSAPGAYLSALKMVLSDIRECGTTRMQSWKMLYQFMRAALAAEHIKKHKSTHLHVHFAHVPTQIAMYAAAIAGISFSFTSHANDLFQRGSLLEQKVERSSRAVTISDYN